VVKAGDSFEALVKASADGVPGGAAAPTPAVFWAASLPDGWEVKTIALRDVRGASTKPTEEAAASLPARPGYVWHVWGVSGDVSREVAGRDFELVAKIRAGKVKGDYSLAFDFGVSARGDGSGVQWNGSDLAVTRVVSIR
jgi:hypothetical protein